MRGTRHAFSYDPTQTRTAQIGTTWERHRYQKYTDDVVEKDRTKSNDRFTDVYTELLDKAEELSQVPAKCPDASAGAWNMSTRNPC